MRRAAAALALLLSAGAGAHLHPHRDPHPKPHQHHGHECIHDLIINNQSRLPNPGPARMYAEYNPLQGRGGARRGKPLARTGMRIKYFWGTSGNCLTASNTQAMNCYCESTADTVPDFQGAAQGCAANQVRTTQLRDYLNQIMDDAIAWLSKALLVETVVGNLKMSEKLCGGRSCNPAEAPYCGGSSWNDYGIGIPMDHMTTGVPNADYVVYLSAVPTGGSTVAWALTCQSDQNGRPTAAHVNFGPTRVDPNVATTTVTYSNYVGTAIHEIMHALGFSSGHWNGKANWFEAHCTALGTPNCKPTITVNERGQTGLTKMATPEVLKKVREYSGCTTLNGAEIEQEGGGGTAGSHWEKRVFGVEGMTGVKGTHEAEWSPMTLAYFYDTGHYDVDYSQCAQDYFWGKGKGCSFWMDKCNEIQPASAREPEFCFPADPSQPPDGCDYHLLATGKCGVSTYGSCVPAEFQYFTQGCQYGGSQSSLTDMCPTQNGYSNTGCTDPAAARANQPLDNNLGQSRASNSRCFVANILEASERYTIPLAELRCFEVECAADCSSYDIVLKTSGGDERVTCTGAGAPTGFNAGNWKSASGTGTPTIECWPIDYMCGVEARAKLGHVCGGAPPTASPSVSPSTSPVQGPTKAPQGPPTVSPTSSPITPPTASPVPPTQSPVSPPTKAPIGAPSVSPSVAPSKAPLAGPTASPSVSPTAAPQSAPSVSPSVSPVGPTASPVVAPSTSPSAGPTAAPVALPTASPQQAPTASPQQAPSVSPSVSPTNQPVPPGVPTKSPVVPPTNAPSTSPSRSPISAPSVAPSVSPTAPPVPGAAPPTVSPSSAPLTPSLSPSASPQAAPTASPVASPTASPQQAPTKSPLPPGVPTVSPVNPTVSPSVSPSASPVAGPTASPVQGAQPTASPSVSPSASPAGSPSTSPSQSPATGPSVSPSRSPVQSPSASPSTAPSASPQPAPTKAPLAPGAPTESPVLPTRGPSAAPSVSPTRNPQAGPSSSPSSSPSASPQQTPSLSPSANPSKSPRHPTVSPTDSTPSPTKHTTTSPTRHPSTSPTRHPTKNPTMSTVSPTDGPTISPTRGPTSASPTLSPSHSVTALPSRGSSESPSSEPSAGAPPTAHTSAGPSGQPLVCPGANEPCVVREQCLRPGCRGSVCVAEVEADSTSCSANGSAGRCIGGTCILFVSAVPSNVGDAVRLLPGNHTLAAYQLRGNAPLPVAIEATQDTFRNLGGSALLCGLWGTAAAAVWLNGTRSNVAVNCLVHVVSNNMLYLVFSPAASMVPRSTEMVTVTLRPALTGRPITVLAAHIILLEEQVGNRLLMDSMVPVAPGSGVLVVSMRTCGGPEDAPPEETGEELGPMYNPLGLSMGSAAWSAYNGALVGDTLLFGAMGAGCFILHMYITVAVRHRATKQGQELPGAPRLMEAARFGCLIAPLTVLYPIWVMVAATVWEYGDSSRFRIYAGATLVICAAVPFFIWRAVRQAKAYAVYKEIELDSQCCRIPAEGWFFSGKAEWTPTRDECWPEFRLTQLFFTSYTERDRYFLSADLMWALVLSLLQAWRPQTESNCELQAIICLTLLLGRTLYVTWRKVYIAPFDNAIDITVGWMEVVSKLLLTMDDPEESGVMTDIAVGIGNVAGVALIVLVCLTLWSFLAGEYGHWVGLVGSRHPGWMSRVGWFAIYWFCFWGAVDVIFEGHDAQIFAFSQFEVMADEASPPAGPTAAPVSPLCVLDKKRGTGALSPLSAPESPAAARRLDSPTWTNQPRTASTTRPTSLSVRSSAAPVLFRPPQRRPGGPRGAARVLSQTAGRAAPTAGKVIADLHI